MGSLLHLYVLCRTIERPDEGDADLAFTSTVMINQETHSRAPGPFSTDGRVALPWHTRRMQLVVGAGSGMTRKNALVLAKKPVAPSQHRGQRVSILGRAARRKFEGAVASHDNVASLPRQ